MLKRALSLILALILCLGILAGCQQTPAETSNPADTTAPAGTTAPAETTVPQETEPEKLYFEEPLVIEMVTPELTLLPDCTYVTNLLKETLNVEIKHTEISMATQYPLMLNDNDLPDITWLDGISYGNEYGPQGAYVNITEYLDQMPNLKAALEENPAHKNLFTNVDGSMYHIPTMKLYGSSTLPSFFYRDDILAKHNLTWPTTREELENLLRELKKLYPDSYPLCIRLLGNAHLTNIVDMGVAFGAKLIFAGRNQAYANYNNETGKWYEGATAPEMKEMITWLKQMLDEGLLHPSGPTMTTDEWRAYLANGDSFICWDKTSMTGAIIQEGVKVNESFNLVTGAPIAMSEAGNAAYLAPDANIHNFLISTSCERLDDVLAYIDWLYSEEGVMLTNYGKEGETYTLDAEGKPVWSDAIKAETADPQNARGLAVSGFYGINDFNAYIGWQPENMAESLAIASANATVTNYYPNMTGLYNADEQAILDTYGEAYQTFVKGELLKFLIGERDLAEWDTFAQTAAKDYHGAELVTVTQAAWDRANAG